MGGACAARLVRLIKHSSLWRRFNLTRFERPPLKNSPDANEMDKQKKTFEVRPARLCSSFPPFDFSAQC